MRSRPFTHPLIKRGGPGRFAIRQSWPTRRLSSSVVPLIGKKAPRGMTFDLRYAEGDRMRVLDWGDTSIAHPFFSLVVTFRFLEEQNRLGPDDPWFERLRDAYLEPWGGGDHLTDTFALALRVGIFAHAIAWLRQRGHLPEQAWVAFDEWFSVVLRRAVTRTLA
jgi:hypothetical protein